MRMQQTLVPIYKTNEFYRSFAVIAWWVWSFLIMRKQLLLYNVIFIKKIYIYIYIYMHDDYGLKHLFTKQEFLEHHEVL